MKYRGHLFRVASGFTLVELLIVIVIIAILAAITVVAYNGITTKAHQAALQTNLAQAGTALAATNTENDEYPETQDDANLKTSSGETAVYNAQGGSDNNSFAYTSYGGGKEAGVNVYCLQESYGTNMSYFITNDNNQPQAGKCVGVSGIVPSTVYAADDFNRADSSSLGSTPFGNQAWQTIGTGTWSISHDTANVNSGADFTAMYINAGHTDGVIQLNTEQSSGYSGILFRFNGDTGYSFVGARNLFSYRLTKLSFASGNTPLIVDSGVNAVPYDILKVVMKGSQLTGYVNNKQVFQVTDSTYSGTDIGILVGDNEDPAQFDDISFTPLP